MPRSRSFVLKISNICRGTRFKTADISGKYFAASALISSCCGKEGKISTDSINYQKISNGYNAQHSMSHVGPGSTQQISRVRRR